MTVYGWIIVVLWIILFAYWAVSATRAKPTVGRAFAWRREVGVRVGILVIVMLALRLPSVRQSLRDQAGVNRNVVAGLAGVLICALGVGLAIVARSYLGRNWGMPMSRKEDPELVTGGPYSVIRHPIYTGFLLAMLGSAIGVSMIWVVALIGAGIYFVYSARREEALMLENFPDVYPAYKTRTKMLLPFVL